MTGRYRLAAAIGQGGMGRVWRAIDEMLDRPVAVKEMRIDGMDTEDTRTRRERTLREARATARIDHPNVVRVYDVVDQGERLWIVMELVEGRSLEQIVRTDGPLSPPEVARVGLGLVAALRQVHAVGVLHRDIKPGNVLIENAGGRVVLTDFGIAAMEDAKALTMAGMIVGSPDYMAPERVSGRPQGPPSDVWSLGATLCAALGGRSPFARDTTLATLHAVLYEEPGLPAAAGPLRDILTAVLEKDPAVRPPLTDLERALGEVAFPQPTPTVATAAPTRVAGTVPRPVPEPPAPGKTSRRRVVALAAAATAATVLTAGAVTGVVLATRQTADDAGKASASTTSTTTSDTTSTTTSDTTSTTAADDKTPRSPTRSTPSPSLAPGARKEAAGFAWVPPEGWRRDDRGAEVYYIAPDGDQQLVAKGSAAQDDLLTTWKASERTYYDNSPSFHTIRLGRTTYQGHPAVVWEYTYTLKGEPWHARLLGFTAGFRSYQLNTWYRPDAEQQALTVYDKVKRGFSVL
ncbi:serine/threonine-protein kinase [Streptomyces sp. YIM S03343]